MSDKSIVGDIINFRGLVYSPLNENGVIFLFGKVMEDLNMYIEEIKPGFPDCVGRRFNGKGWEQVTIEFEYQSSNFKDHKHDPNKCDIIVCWHHNWSDCPLEVLELKEIIKGLENQPIERPDTTTGGEGGGDDIISIEEQLKKYPQQIGKLFYSLEEKLKEELSDDIWKKVGSTLCSFYCPERVFLYIDLQKSGLKLMLFTNGQNVEGVRNYNNEKGGAKWGTMKIRNEADIEKALDALKESHALIKKALKNNEPTGWYAEKAVPDIDEEN